MKPHENPYQVRSPGILVEDIETSSRDIEPRSRPAFPRWKFWGWMFVYFYPLIGTACFYSCWVVASIQLGRAPRPMVDDPSLIGGATSFFYVFSGIALLAIPGSFPLGIIACIEHPIRWGKYQIGALVLAMAYVSIFFTMIWVFRSDPGQVLYWWLD